MAQLKGHCGGGQTLLLQKQQRTGVKHIQTEVAAHLQSQIRHNGQMAQIADGHGGNVGVVLQCLTEIRLVCRAEDSRQDGTKGGLSGIGGQIQCIQQLQRDIHRVGAAGDQFGRQLLRLHNGAGETGR